MSITKGFEKTAGLRSAVKDVVGKVLSYPKTRHLENLADKQMQLAFKSKPGYATAHVDRAENYLRAAKGKP